MKPPESAIEHVLAQDVEECAGGVAEHDVLRVLPPQVLKVGDVVGALQDVC